MAKARRRKNTSFETEPVKSVFLYGEPNKEKLSLLIKAQSSFLSLVNGFIRLLAETEGYTLQLVKNDKKDPSMRKLEKLHRASSVNSAFSQNAFDMAVTRLSSRLDSIHIAMLSEHATVFTRSKVLFAMSIDRRGKQEMEEAIAALSKEEDDFYDTCAAAIHSMSDDDFSFAMREFHDSYAMHSIEYRIPELSSVEIRWTAASWKSSHQRTSKPLIYSMYRIPLKRERRFRSRSTQADIPDIRSAAGKSRWQGRSPFQSGTGKSGYPGLTNRRHPSQRPFIQMAWIPGSPTLYTFPTGKDTGRCSQYLIFTKKRWNRRLRRCRNSGIRNAPSGIIFIPIRTFRNKRDVLS